MMTILKTQDVLMLYIILYHLIITHDIHITIPTHNVYNHNKRQLSHFYNQLSYVTHSSTSNTLKTPHNSMLMIALNKGIIIVCIG